MGCFSVIQRTKDGMFNATSLLKQWNESSGESKEIKKFFENQNTKEFIEALLDEENLHGQNFAYVKSKASRGENAGTWMHPILFVKFAMWLNPRFEVQVIKFVYDQMITFRKEAGDAYKALGSAVGRLVPRTEMESAMHNVAVGLNYCVFNKHETAIRNQYGTEKRQREIFELERKLADLINEGFLKSYDEVMQYLRKRWREKWLPNVFR